LIPAQNRRCACGSIERQRHQINKVASDVQAMTTPVPSASDNGRLRLGFFTSPAVNVHCSMRLPKTAAYLRHGKNRQCTHHHDRAAHTDLHRVLRAKLALCQKFPKFAATALRVAPQRENRRRPVPTARKLRGGENV